MAETKITESMILEEIKERLADTDYIVAWADKKLAQKAAKVEKEAERRAKKRENKEVDAMTTAILDALTDDFKSADEIATEIAPTFPDVTKAKVAARLRGYITEGTVEKEVFTTEDKSKVTKYKLAQA